MKNKKNRFALANSVFLISQSEGQWTARIAFVKPDPNALKLCKEKDYPVSMFYCRYDINGSNVYEEDICNSREELLTSLNWSGKCGHTIRHLWDFRFEENRDPQIADLFAESYNVLMKNIQADGPYAEAEDVDYMIDAAEMKPSLADQINNASFRVENDGAGAKENDLSITSDLR